MKLKEIYKDVIFEGRSKEISYEKLGSYLESDNFSFDPNSTRIFRIIKGFNKDFGIVRPKQASKKRRSKNTANYYTFIMDNSKYWDGYPKRSESVVCLTENPKDYLVIPRLDSKVGICPKRDLWFSFTDFGGIEKGFNLSLNCLWLYSQYESDKRIKSVKHSNSLIPSETYSEFRKSIKKMDNTIQESVDRSYEDYLNIVDSIPRERLVKMFLDSKYERLYNFLEYVLEPDRNNFKLKKYEKDFELSSEVPKEVWTDGPCLLVKKKYVGRIISDYGLT